MCYTFLSREVVSMSLKKLIQKYSKRITLLIIIFLIMIIGFFNLLRARQEANESAKTTFYHIEQILNENQKDLKEQEKTYRQTCIDHAQAVAYIIQENQDVLNDVETLRKIAKYIEVDEIHIFNKQGVIITGTHPEYYGYSFDSGKQMNFFKPLLENKELQLTQKITENTAAHKKMQYSALWSENKEFIVQVGMKHENAKKATEKNQLSYLFKLFRVNSEVKYYAIDCKTDTIVGSTHQHIGNQAQKIGLKKEQLKESTSGFFTPIEGKPSYCVSKKIDNNYVYRILPVNVLFKNVPMNCLEMLLCLAIISIFFEVLIVKYIHKYVIDSIEQINHQLYKISKGNLEEEVAINNSLEFQQLSHYINEMKHSILMSNKKMDYILDKTNQYIGFYEYNLVSKTIYISQAAQDMLSIDMQQYHYFKGHVEDFVRYLKILSHNAVENEDRIYYLSSNELYIKIDEKEDEKDIFGVLLDVTDSFKKRKKAETERDIDSLTQLYNRRGLEKRVNALLKEGIQQGTLVFIDSDGLKQVNDIYGHHQGDLYLNAIAQILKSYPQEHALSGRLGGDEFVIFFYNYDSQEEMNKVLDELKQKQDQQLYLTEDCLVHVGFSCGFCDYEKEFDFSKMLGIADQRMYENKRKRKGN